MRHEKTSSWFVVRSLVLACPVVLGAVTGCAMHANYPPIGTAEDDAAVNDPNAAPVPTIVQAALRRVIERFPVQGEYNINLPQGMTRRRAEEIVTLLRQPGARLPSSASQELPTYHVTRVWLRPGGTSTVEILRPVFGVGTPGTEAQYQPVSVNLRRSPLEDWQVDSTRVWPIGSAVPPPLYGWE